MVKLVISLGSNIIKFIRGVRNVTNKKSKV